MKNTMMPVAAVCTTLLGLISVPAAAATQYTWEPDYTSRTHYSSDRLRKTQICGYGERSDSSCGGKFVAVPGAEPPEGIDPPLSSRCIGNVPGRLNLVEATNIANFNAARFTFEIVSGNPDYPTAYFLSNAAHNGEGKGTKNVFCAAGTTASQAWDWVNAYGGTWDRENERRYVMIDANNKSWGYLALWVNETNSGMLGDPYIYLWDGSQGGYVYDILGENIKFRSLNYYRPVGANQSGSVRQYLPYLWPTTDFCNKWSGEKKIQLTSSSIQTVNKIRRFTLRYSAADTCPDNSGGG